MTGSFLLIDGAPEFRQILQRCLHAQMPNVSVTEIDTDSIDFEQPGPDWSSYDLILLGQYLARDDGDGFVLLKHLTAASGYPPVVFLGETSNVRDVVRVMKAGAVDFIAKPELSAAALLPLLTEALRARLPQRTPAFAIAGDDVTSFPAPVDVGDQTQEMSRVDLERVAMRGSAAAEDLPPGDDSADPEVPGYSIVGKIGDGGMAKVYLGIQQSDGATVVLKVVPTQDDSDFEMLKRFIREFELAAGLRHPNVVRIFEQAFARDYAYIAMEHLAGGDLAKRIRAGLNEAEAVDILAQIASGLAAIHEIGIVHRDLKPSTVLFKRDGGLAITDFGAAKDLRLRIRDITDDNVIVGTPLYMSPEQGHGGEPDARSDLYSLGVLFYQMLTGEKPFHGSSWYDVIQAHQQDPVPQLPARFASYQPLVDGMLAKHPDDRFQTAHELLIGIDWVQP